MEFSSIGSLGLFLLLGFVMPGFCYLLLFALCFHEELTDIIEWCTAKKVTPAYVLTSLAVVGGLLLTSISFAIEILTGKALNSIGYPPFPDLEMHRIAMVEAAGKGSFYLNMITGSAIMHFNIGVGSLLFLLVGFCPVFTRHKRRYRWVILVFIAVVVVANFTVASRLYPKAKQAIDVAAKVVDSGAGGKLSESGLPKETK